MLVHPMVHGMTVSSRTGAGVATGPSGHVLNVTGYLLCAGSGMGSDGEG